MRRAAEETGLSWQAPALRQTGPEALDPTGRVGDIWLRKALAQDLEAIGHNEQAAYAFPWTRGNFDDALAAGYDLWCLASADGLIGHAALMWSPDEVHLLNITIAPSRQGRGLGRALLRWLCRDALARGAGRMLLEVRPSNAVAMALYEQEGFACIGLRKGYYPSWNNSREDARVYVRVLTDPFPS